jgi:putative hemolysin
LDVLELFKQSGNHMALVVDEFGSIQGLVTLHDILEAVVGDVSVAGEAVEPRAVQRDDGSWLLDGLLPVDELRERFQLAPLPGEQQGAYQTLGGFVMTQLGRIPAVADHFVWGDRRFEVVDMDGHRVDKVLVTPITPDSASETTGTVS